MNENEILNMSFNFQDKASPFPAELKLTGIKILMIGHASPESCIGLELVV